MTCLSELFIAAAVFVFAIGVMVNSERGSGSDVDHADVNHMASLEENTALNIVAAKPVAEFVDLQMTGTDKEKMRQAQAYGRQLKVEVASQADRSRSFQSLESEGSHWVILSAWQEYEDSAAYPDTASRLAILPVAAVEGYTMVAATYSFTHYSGYAVKPGEPIRVRF